MDAKGRVGTHFSTIARTIRLDQDGCPDHRAVERELPGVVGDEQNRTGRDVLETVSVDAEVVLVEPQERGHGGARELQIEPEGIDPELILAGGQAVQLFVPVVATD